MHGPLFTDNELCMCLIVCWILCFCVGHLAAYHSTAAYMSNSVLALRYWQSHAGIIQMRACGDPLHVTSRLSLIQMGLELIHLCLC